MNFPQQYWGYFVAINAIVAVMYLSQTGERRTRLGQVLVALLSLFVITFVTVAITSNKLAKSNAGVATDQAEMQLRIVACVSSVTANMSSKVKNMLLGAVEGKVGEHKRDDSKSNTITDQSRNYPQGTNPNERRDTNPAPNQAARSGQAVNPKTDSGPLTKLGAGDLAGDLQKKLAYEGAVKALGTAIAKNPHNILYKQKLIVLLGKIDQKSNQQEIDKLIVELKNNEREHSPSAQNQGSELGAAVPFSTILESLYIRHAVYPRLIQSYATEIKTNMSSGWFQDNALMQLYSTAGAEKELDNLKSSIDTKYATTFFKLALIMIIMIGSAFIGVINILIQLGTAARRPAKLPDAVELRVPLTTIYVVFLSWFSIMLTMSMGFHFVTEKFPQLTTQPVLVALTTAITYLLSNLPGPFLIYFLALKPQGLDFWSGLNLRSRTSTAGPVKLVGSGLLAWCSAIPLIFASAFVAQRFLHTQGSDNPVIGQIVQAAGSSSAAATLIFYLTLGVMAPIFEEILFRGFFYASVKPRIGAFPAMLASAALFALLHFDKGGILMLFAIGFVLAYTFEKTRSLLPSMVAHGLWNSGSFTMALVLFGA